MYAHTNDIFCYVVKSAVIDDFIAHADADLDGYLNFVEYTSAIRNKEQLLSDLNEGNEIMSVDINEINAV